MARNKRLFLILWLAGMAGVLSFLLVDISAVVMALPVPEGMPPPELPPPALLKLAAVFQPAVLTSAAVVVGIWLAPKVGLHAPVAEAFANDKPVWPALRPQLIPGIAAGIGCGTAIVAAWVIAKPLMPADFVSRALEFNKFIPHAVRILYGGFTEEILLRWGVMTVLVWLLWRVLQLGAGHPRGVFVVGAIVVSAILFGAGHLPIASALAGGLTLPIVIYVIVANSLFGIAAGFLYWRRGLEAAMIAHMFAHVVLIAAIYTAL
ncbi:MAG TPA: CPBP family intramembrane glutamic endopeptidase [Pyrinomonadaceae bacterium]|nr:CPBP family intramembrane glutamic endopeptidase [Pyrinomonadaceae bacterium]